METTSGTIEINGMAYFALYLYFSYCVYRIACKAEVDHAWLAFVPVLQFFILVEASGKSWMWLLGLMIPVVDILALVVIGMGLADQRGRNSWLGILLAIPGLNLLFLGYLAFFEKEVPAVLPPGPPRILSMDCCVRCRVNYKPYSNRWNSEGYCSRACYRHAGVSGEVTA